MLCLFGEGDGLLLLGVACQHNECARREATYLSHLCYMVVAKESLIHRATLSKCNASHLLDHFFISQINQELVEAYPIENKVLTQKKPKMAYEFPSYNV